MLLAHDLSSLSLSTLSIAISHNIGKGSKDTKSLVLETKGLSVDSKTKRFDRSYAPYGESSSDHIPGIVCL